MILFFIQNGTIRSLLRNLNARINFLTKNFVIEKLGGGGGEEEGGGKKIDD